MKSLTVILFGVITTAMTLVLLVLVEFNYHFSLYGLSVKFFIPMGAMAAGLAAASGYYAGSRFLHYRPGPFVLATIVALSVGSLFGIYWLRYQLFTVDGTPLSQVLTYSQYLSYSLSHSYIRFGIGAEPITGPIGVGSAGYLLAVSHIVGFAIGGIAIYAGLRKLAYCESCQLYLSKKAEQTRYFSREDSLNQSAAEVLTGFDKNQLRRAVELHAAAGGASASDANFASTLAIKRCAACETHWLGFTARRKEKGKWKGLSGISRSTFTPEPITLTPAR